MDTIQKRRGRKAIHNQVLNSSGLTPQQYDIIRRLASDSGISMAAFRRQMVRDYLNQFGYSDEDQGLHHA